MEVVNKLIILVLSAFLAIFCGLVVGGLITIAAGEDLGAGAGVVTAVIIFPKAVEKVKSFWKGL